MSNDALRIYPMVTSIRTRNRYVIALSVAVLCLWSVNSALSQSKEQNESSRKVSAEDMVEIRFSTYPVGTRAKVIHGRKTFGVTPFVLTLPTDSAFRAVRVVAKGFITLNSRFHTFKDHKRVFQLVKADEAHTLLGYKHLPPDAAIPVLDAGVTTPKPDVGQSDQKMAPPAADTRADAGAP